MKPRLFTTIALYLGASSVLAVCAAPVGAQQLNLPDPLKLPDNSLLTTKEQWQSEQRQRVFDVFQGQVYGKPTQGRPQSMAFNVIETDPQALGGQATLKRVEIVIQDDAMTSSLTIRLVLFTPNAAQAPARAFLMINPFKESDTDPTRAVKSERWPAEAVIARGFAIASFYASDVDPDQPSFDNGVHKFYDASARAGNDTWGTLAAWAWGASRAMDYLETDALIDPNGVAVLGHSRGGKAALWAGATDERFVLTVSNDSGEGGAAISRRNHGEGILDLNSQFPHWFSLNYRNYNGAPETLPVDHHELVALMAPRAVYVASASDDDWADPEGEFLAVLNAAPVFALFGSTGLGTGKWPAPGEHIHGDQMAYHLRQGVHDLTLFDWNLYMDFFDTVELKSDDGAGGAPGGAGAPASAGTGGAPIAGSAGAPQSGGGTPPNLGAVAGGGSGGASNAAATPSGPATAGGCGCRLVPPAGHGQRWALTSLALLALVLARRALSARGRKYHDGPPRLQCRLD